MFVSAEALTPRWSFDKTAGNVRTGQHCPESDFTLTSAESLLEMEVRKMGVDGNLSKMSKG